MYVHRITMEETVAELFRQAYRTDLHLEFPTREELNKIEKKKRCSERLEIMRKIGSLEAEIRELKGRLKYIEENTRT